MDKRESQTLALCAMFQATELIEQIASGGQCDQQAFNALQATLFTGDAASVEAVYGSLEEFRVGMEALLQYLGGQKSSTAPYTPYYLLAVMKVAQILMRDGDLATTLGKGLDAINQQAAQFEMTPDAVSNRVGGLYQETISKLPPGIQVRGQQVYLQDSDNAARVRVLLLAAIRSAVLWYQKGGGKWQLLFSRKRYVNQAREWLQQSKPNLH